MVPGENPPVSLREPSPLLRRGDYCPARLNGGGTTWFAVPWCLGAQVPWLATIIPQLRVARGDFDGQIC
jgi:hypothetical protein